MVKVRALLILKSLYCGVFHWDGAKGLKCRHSIWFSQCERALASVSGTVPCVGCRVNRQACFGYLQFARIDSK